MQPHLPQSPRRQPRRDRRPRHAHAPRDGHRRRRRLLRRRPRRAPRARRRRGLPHRPGARRRESYLRVDKIVDVAKKAGCDAIHPGYGFLSENPALARGVRARGHRRSSARPRARCARWAARPRRATRWPPPACPSSPARRCETTDEATAAATKIGFPVMLKAASRRRRQGHAPRRERRARWRARGSARAARRRSSSATTRSTSRRRSSGRATSRSRCSAIATATSSTSSSATARSSAATRRSSRRRRRPAASRELVARMGAIAVQGAKAVGYFSRGHVRVPPRRGRQLLLPRDEHAPAGRAPGHRARHGPRSRARDGARRAGRDARLRAGGPRRARRGHRVPHLRRGSRRAGFLPSPGRHRAASSTPARPRRARRRRRLRGLHDLELLRSAHLEAQRVGARRASAPSRACAARSPSTS